MRAAMRWVGLIPAWFVPGVICAAWTISHFAASHVYVHLCTPLSLAGFVSSPLMVATPHCTALRWFIQNGANNISAFWVTTGVATIAVLSS